VGFAVPPDAFFLSGASPPLRGFTGIASNALPFPLCPLPRLGPLAGPDELRASRGLARNKREFVVAGGAFGGRGAEQRPCSGLSCVAR